MCVTSKEDDRCTRWPERGVGVEEGEEEGEERETGSLQSRGQQTREVQRWGEEGAWGALRWERVMHQSLQLK